MQDKQLLTDQINGLTEKLKSLRIGRDLFVKAQGLDEQKEKALLEVENLKGAIIQEKEGLKKLIEKKNRIVQSVTDQFAAKMNELLPRGSAEIRITDDGQVIIAWKNGELYVPYSGLSGGEKVAFDGALVAALGATVIIVEAAEEDPENLARSLEQYAATDKQVIVNSAHAPARIPDGWKVVRL